MQVKLLAANVRVRHDAHFISVTDFWVLAGSLSVGALTMNRDLALTPSQYGWAAGVFFAGYCLFEVPSNLALHRIGARKWLARIMVTWGIASTATAVLPEAVGPTSTTTCRGNMGCGA